MSAIANIVINDGQATPVAHTFTPITSSPDAVYHESGSSIPTIGENLITISKKIGQSADGLDKITMTLKLPVLETPSGGTPSGYTAPPAVAYFLQTQASFFLPKRSTPAQRKDLRVLLSNLLANTQVTDAIEKLETPY